MKILILAAAAVCLSGCATGASLTPEQAQAMATAFHNAGCGGRVDIDAGAATGQIGGEAHVTLGLHGECPPAGSATWQAAPSDTPPTP